MLSHSQIHDYRTCHSFLFANMCEHICTYCIIEYWWQEIYTSDYHFL